MREENSSQRPTYVANLGPSPSLNTPLVFVSYNGDPQEQARDSSRKKLVSRWAVVNSLRYRPRVEERSVGQYQIWLSHRSDPNDPKTHNDHYSTRSHLVRTGDGECSPSPLGLLSAASKDPFTSLPIKMNHTSWRLLHYWLEAEDFSFLRAEFQSADLKLQVATIRKETCFSASKSSRAILGAILAILSFDDPKIFAKGSTDSDEKQHGKAIGLALNSLRIELAQSKIESMASCAIASTMLMTTAVRNQDEIALQVHFNGLVALLSNWPCLITNGGQAMYTIWSWAIGCPEVKCLANLPKLLHFDCMDATVQVSSSSGRGFKDLSPDYISRNFVCEMSAIFAQNPLLELARHETLSLQDAADILRVHWQISLWLKQMRHTRDLENACRYSVVLCLTLEKLSFPAGNNLGVFASAALLHLRRTNETILSIAAQKAQLWIIFTVGPHLEDAGELRLVADWAKDLCRNLSLQDYNSVRGILTSFLLTSRIDYNAQAFWNFCYVEWDSATLSEGVRRASGVLASDDKAALQPSSLPHKCPSCMRQGCGATRLFLNLANYPDWVKSSMYAMSPSLFYSMCEML